MARRSGSAMPSFTSASTPSRMSLPGREMRCDIKHELVATSAGAAVIRAEDQPSIGCCESGPVVPVGAKAIAVCIGRTSVNEGEHAQMFCALFTQRINQDTFDLGAIVSLPAIGVPLRLRALMEDRIELRDCFSLRQRTGVIGEKDLGRVGNGGMQDNDFVRMQRSLDSRICACCSLERLRMASGNFVELLLCTGESGGNDGPIVCDCIVFERAGEVVAESVYLSACRIYGIQAALHVLILAFE